MTDDRRSCVQMICKSVKPCLCLVHEFVGFLALPGRHSFGGKMCIVLVTELHKGAQRADRVRRRKELPRLLDVQRADSFKYHR